MKSAKVMCLYCQKSFRSRLRAKKHSCPTKKAAEQRLGVKLATYDSLQSAIDNA
jgi:hypothetical protein